VGFDRRPRLRSAHQLWDLTTTAVALAFQYTATGETDVRVYANNDDVTAHEALRGGLVRALAAVLSPGGTRPHALSRGLVAVLGVRVV